MKNVEWITADSQRVTNAVIVPLKSLTTSHFNLQLYIEDNPEKRVSIGVIVGWMLVRKWLRNKSNYGETKQGIESLRDQLSQEINSPETPQLKILAGLAGLIHNFARPSEDTGTQRTDVKWPFLTKLSNLSARKYCLLLLYWCCEFYTFGIISFEQVYLHCSLLLLCVCLLLSLWEHVLEQDKSTCKVNQSIENNENWITKWKHDQPETQEIIQPIESIDSQERPVLHIRKR